MSSRGSRIFIKYVYWVSSISLYFGLGFLFCFLRLGFYINLELISWPHWMPSKHWRSVYLCLLTFRVTSTIGSFLHDRQESKFRHHVCLASTLPCEKSLQLLQHISNRSSSNGEQE